MVVWSVWFLAAVLGRGCGYEGQEWKTDWFDEGTDPASQIILLLFVIFSFICALLFIFNAILVNRVKESLRGFMLALFCAALTMWGLGYTGAVFAISNNDTVVPYMEYGATYVLPVFFCGYMLTNTTEHTWRRRFCMLLEVLYAGLFLLATGLQLFSLHHDGYIRLLNICYVFFFAGGIVLIAMIFTDRKHFGAFARIGFMVVLILAIVEVIASALARMEVISDLVRQKVAVQQVTPVIVLVLQATLLINYLMQLIRVYQRRQEFEKLEEAAYIDGLTGLANRNSFEEKEVPRLEQSGDYAIAFLDTDRLKETNDRYGHRAGDDLLRKVGSAVRAGCSEHGCCGYRYGGDEFLVVGPGESEVKAAVGQMRKMLQKSPLGASGEEVTVSVGVAYRRNEVDSIELVIREADEAMYREKQRKHEERKE